MCDSVFGESRPGMRERGASRAAPSDLDTDRVRAACGVERMMSTRFRFFLSAICMLPCAALTHAQLLPKIPPAPAPAPEYVPPPKPPTREAAPAAAEPPAPNLVVRGGDGKLKTYDISLEEAAVRAYDFPPDRRTLVDASMEARRQDVERFVVNNLEKVHAAIKMRAKVENITDFTTLFEAREVAQPLIQERLLDRLLRESAITGAQRVRLDEAVQTYETARREQWKEETGSDLMKITSMVGRQSFIDITRDVFAALDRLVNATAPTLVEEVHMLELSPEQAAELGKKHDAASTRVFILETLNIEQQKTLFRKRLAPDKAPAAAPVVRPAAPADTKAP